MHSIGFRASPRDITYAVVEGTPGSYTAVTLDLVQIPQALQVPHQLHFLRTVLLDVMQEYGVTRAGLRIAETTARSRSIFRDNVEGVLQELLASSSVEWYFAGRIATIASLLGYVDRRIIRQFITGDQVPPYSVNWNTYSEAEREAFLTACAAISGAPLSSAASSLAGIVGNS